MQLVLISILIGVAIGLVIVSALKAQLKTVVRQTNAGSYEVAGSLRLSANSDTYLYQNTTRIPRAKPKK